MRSRRPNRPAFTLVEMLVAVALTLVIMVIIAQAFASATRTFSTLRTAGQLQEKTRSAAAMIRRDLTAEHFDGPFIPGRSGPRVGDQRLDQAGWVPPRAGYFEVRQFGTSTFEPVNAPTQEPEGLPSTRADSHIARFTVKLPGGPAAELYCAELQAAPAQPGEPSAADRRINSFPTGSTVVYSRWAEVQYFLYPNGDATPATANGPSLPLYSLRRRLRVLATTGVTYDVNAQRAAVLMAQYPDLGMAVQGPSSTPNNVLLRVLGPEDVTNPAVRLPYQQPAQRVNNAGGTFPTGDDIVLTDVLSFEVKASWFSNPTFEAILTNSSPAVPTLLGSGNTDDPFSDLPPSTLNNGAYAGVRVFDTWYRAPNLDDVDWDRPAPTVIPGTPGFLSRRIDQVPVRINLRALQIRLRIWDSLKNQARQMTIVQEI